MDGASLYILRCADTGLTRRDVDKRVSEHQFSVLTTNRRLVT